MPGTHVRAREHDFDLDSEPPQAMRTDPEALDALGAQRSRRVVRPASRVLRLGDRVSHEIEIHGLRMVGMDRGRALTSGGDPRPPRGAEHLHVACVAEESRASSTDSQRPSSTSFRNASSPAIGFISQ